jgi:pimeloyl-ACP methyl ester carboxylesterase
MRSHLLVLLSACVWLLSGCGPLPTQPASATAQRALAAASAPALQRFAIEVEGQPLTLWLKEPVARKGAILLIHGRTWSALPNFDLKGAGSERSVMNALAAAGYAAYALDMRGYGATPRDPSGWLTPDRASADVAAILSWIASRERRPPALLGYSQGSLVAQLTAQREPTLISALILFGYPRDPLNPPRLEPPPAEPPRELNTPQRAQSDFISPAVTPRAVVDAYVAAALEADPIRVDWRNQEQFAALDPAQVLVPTLVLHGERDPLAPLVAQARLFTQLGNPDRRWIILAGGDHAALVEDTQGAFIAAIVSFLERP